LALTHCGCSQISPAWQLAWLVGHYYVCTSVTSAAPTLIILIAPEAAHYMANSMDQTGLRWPHNWPRICLMDLT